MARPTDWDVLDLDHDPTPGDPWRIKELGKRLQDLGDEAERAARDVRGLAGDPAAMNWIGASGDAFRDHIGKFPGQLDKVATSHHLCASALLTFADALDGHQSQADRALVQARPLHDQVKRLQDQLHAANADLTSANKGVDSAHAASTVDPTAVHNAVQSQTNAKNAVDSLNSQLSGPAGQLEALKKLARQAEDLRHSDEDTARSKINAATDAGIPPDSFWHKVGEIAAAVWHGLVIVAKIVSFVGAIVLMVVGGPLWLIVAVVVAGLIILADTLYKYSQGKASLWDVGLAVLACIPITKGFTSMAAVADAFRAGGMLGAGMHIAGAIGGAAKDMVVGMAALLKGGGGRVAEILADGSRIFRESAADPLAKWGAGAVTHPEEWANTIKALEDAGVTVLMSDGRGALAYSPAMSTGAPGEMIIDAEASIGALRHEAQHAFDDLAQGWGGYRQMENSLHSFRMEYRAYWQEVQYARELGDTASEAKLVAACQKELETHLSWANPEAIDDLAKDLLDKGTHLHFPDIGEGDWLKVA
ncbi:MAG: hypothetical protein HOV83_08175 [Catenulispora sp.]|nr:hypothetical protein [Catenulispora sp.]